MAARPNDAALSLHRRLPGLQTVQLQEIDRHQDHVKEDDGIDVRDKAVGAEQAVACQCEHPKRSDRGHAETCKNRERRAKAQAVHPRHDRLAISLSSSRAATWPRAAPKAW